MTDSKQVENKPHEPQDFIEVSERNDEAPRRRTFGRRALKIGGVTAVGAGLLSAGIFFGTSINHEHTTSAPEPKDKDRQPVVTPEPVATSTPEVSASVSTTPSTEASSEITAPAGTLEIPASLSPKQMGYALIQNDWNEWRMAGTTKGLFTKSANSGEGFDKFSLDLANDESKKYIDALFVPEWESRPGIAQFKQYMVDNNERTIRAYIATEAAKTEPFTWSASVDSIVPSAPADGIVELKITITQHDNAADNNIGQLSGGAEIEAIDGTQSILDVKLRNSDGFMKISGITQTSASGASDTD